MIQFLLTFVFIIYGSFLVYTESSQGGVSQKLLLGYEKAQKEFNELSLQQKKELKKKRRKSEQLQPQLGSENESEGLLHHSPRERRKLKRQKKHAQ